MDLFTLIRVVLRRWPLVLVILLTSGFLAYAAQSRTPPAYEATGFIVLGAPEVVDPAGRRSTVDPLLLSEGLDVERSGSVPDVAVSSLGGSTYVVTAAASGSDQAIADVEGVIEQLVQRVAAVQEADGVLEDERVDLRLVSPQITVERQPDGTFLAQAQVFMYDPVSGSSNPYQPNATTGRLLQVEVSSDAAREEFVQRAGPGVEFEVRQQARDAAPLLNVVTTGSDAGQVMAAFDVVANMLDEELREREDRAGVSTGQRLSLEVIDAPTGVVDNSPPVRRAAIAIVGLGVMLALGLTIGLESVRRHRARRAAAPAPEVPTRPSGSRFPVDESHGPGGHREEQEHADASMQRSVQHAVPPT